MRLSLLAFVRPDNLDGSSLQFDAITGAGPDGITTASVGLELGDWVGDLELLEDGLRVRPYQLVSGGLVPSGGQILEPGEIITVSVSAAVAPLQAGLMMVVTDDGLAVNREVMVLDRAAANVPPFPELPELPELPSLAAIVDAVLSEITPPHADVPAVFVTRVAVIDACGTDPILDGSGWFDDGEGGGAFKLRDLGLGLTNPDLTDLAVVLVTNSQTKNGWWQLHRPVDGSPVPATRPEASTVISIGQPVTIGDISTGAPAVLLTNEVIPFASVWVVRSTGEDQDAWEAGAAALNLGLAYVDDAMIAGGYTVPYWARAVRVAVNDPDGASLPISESIPEITFEHTGEGGPVALTCAGGSPATIVAGQSITLVCRNGFGSYRVL